MNLIWKSYRLALFKHFFLWFVVINGSQGLYTLAQPDTRKVINNAFAPGELLRLRVHYGLITAGYATFEVLPAIEKVNDKDCYHIRAGGKSLASFNWFFPVDDQFDTWVDKDAFIPYKYNRKVHEGSFKYQDNVVFDYKAMTVTGKQGVFKIKSGVQDMVSAIYYARTLNLTEMKAGTVIKLDAFMDDKVYNLGIKILGKETLKTALGTFKTIKISPTVVAGRVFKGANEMKVWVTDDENYLPLKIESPVIVGNISVDLKSFSGLKHPLRAKIK
jgi:hypothetical protein